MKTELLKIEQINTIWFIPMVDTLIMSFQNSFTISLQYSFTTMNTIGIISSKDMTLKNIDKMGRMLGWYKVISRQLHRFSFSHLMIHS